jgi:hypothetical protein
MDIYKTLIRPVVTYGAETWTMTKKEEQAVLIFERKIFRRIYGAKYEGGQWKSRTNRELEELSKRKNIVKWIMGQRISWLGQLERTEEDRMAKKIFTQELEERGRRGRSRKGWREVEKDLQVLGVRRWRELVIVGKYGEVLFDRPKPTAGCSANGKRLLDFNFNVSGFHIVALFNLSKELVYIPSNTTK